MSLFERARTVLADAGAYERFQHLVGAPTARHAFVREYVDVEPGMRLLDIGCGPGALLEAIPRGVTYVGVDVSETYLDAARARYGDRATFVRAQVAPGWRLEGHAPFERAIAVGMLHHLDDASARTLIEQAYDALGDGGVFVSIDPALVEGQSPVARALIRRDRGEHVRRPRDYAALVRSVFGEVDVQVRHDLLRIPYSHCVVRARR